MENKNLITSWFVIISIGLFFGFASVLSEIRDAKDQIIINIENKIDGLGVEDSNNIIDSGIPNFDDL